MSSFRFILAVFGLYNGRIIESKGERVMQEESGQSTTSNSQEEPKPETKTKKSHTGRNVFIGLAIGLIIVIGVPVLIAGYFGLVPGVSTLMGATKAKDLGVTYTPQDYQAFLTKTQTNLQNYANAPVSPDNPAKKTVFADPVVVNNQVVSQEELTAAINESGWLWMPIKNAQVKLTDGTVEIAGNLQLDYITQFISYIGGVGYSQSDIDTAVGWGKKLVNNAPIYIKASGSVTNNQLQLSVQEAQIGRYSVPPEIAQQVLSAGTQSAINNTPHLDAQSATLNNGTITFTGTHPSTIYVKTQ